ncbi:MAG: hypothetical protein QXT73_00340 [Candidatus Methanomethylicaceae archaeon]
MKLTAKLTLRDDRSILTLSAHKPEPVWMFIKHKNGVDPVNFLYLHSEDGRPIGAQLVAFRKISEISVIFKDREESTVEVDAQSNPTE